MKASQFSDAQKVFILKQGDEGVMIRTLQTGPVLVRVFRCIFLAGKGTEDDEGIAVFGRPEGVHSEAG